MGNEQKQRYSINIFEEEIVLSDFTGVTEKRYLINREQLMGFFESEVTLRPFPGLIWMKKGKGETYLITLPAKERTITLNTFSKKKERSEEITIKTPRLLVKVAVLKPQNNINDIDLWCYFDEELTWNTILYALPLPNFSRESLCLGGGSAIKVDKSLTEAVETAIFEVPFNHHSQIVGAEKLTFAAYRKKYKNTCPKDSLEPLGIARPIL
jgi:hypothetical protein